MAGRFATRLGGRHNGDVSAPDYPDDWEADVLLRNGRPIHLRPITAADGDALRAFHAQLSDRTVYFRFFSAKPELTDRDVTYFTEVDHQSRVAFVAVDRAGILGVGRFDALGDGSAEVAFVIRDDLQGLGLGSVLLEHLTAAARERGVRRFVAEVLPDNVRMIATFREAGYEVRQRREDDVLAVSFDIETTASSRAVMEAREHRAEARSVQRLLHPARVAVVGASRSPGGLGHELLRHIVDGGYRGDLVAVHPEVDQILGVRCVRALADVEGTIDLVVVVVPAQRVAAVIEDAARAGVHGLVVVSGGFGDVGGVEGDGPALQAELVALVHRTGMRLVGPNALGLVNTDDDVRLNASLVEEMPPAGRVGFFSQSGALGGSILERFRRRGLGLSTFVSAGNRADISGNDLLQYWEEDPDTDLVMLYLETIGNARKFARIVHRLSAQKPVVMVRTGGAGQRHPLGHAVRSTLLSQRAVDTILGDCGLIVVESIDQLIAVARIAGSLPLPTCSTVAIVGNSDALAVMAVNGCERTVLGVAGEPVTFARQASCEAYERAIRDALDDPRVGCVLVIFVPPIEDRSDVEIRETLRRCVSASGGTAVAKPVVAVMVGATGDQSPSDVPAFRDVEEALQALSAVARYADWRRGPTSVAVDLSDGGAPGAGPVAEGDYTGAGASRLLESLGPVIRQGGRNPRLGCRVRLFDDPLYGPVIVAGVDDPVAEALDDRSYRLAPVSVAGARRMLDDLDSLEVVLREVDDVERYLSDLSRCISDVSALAVNHPEVTRVDARRLVLPVVPSGELTSEEISVTVLQTHASREPDARRM